MVAGTDGLDVKLHSLGAGVVSDQATPPLPNDAAAIWIGHLWEAKQTGDTALARYAAKMILLCGGEKEPPKGYQLPLALLLDEETDELQHRLDDG